MPRDLVVLLLLPSVLLLACVQEPGPVGKELYATQCASCHGVDLAGQPGWQSELPDGGVPAPPQDDSGHTWHHPDWLLLEITKNGGQATAQPGFKSRMPGFAGTLGDAEIWAILDFIKSHWSDEHRASQEFITRMQKPPPQGPRPSG